MDYQTALKRYDNWLLNLGFKTANFPPLKTIYYRDDFKNPDQISGANFVIFELLDGISTPEQQKSRVNILFLDCIKFFKKGMGSFKLAKNFCAFFIFPISESHPELIEYVTKTRPVSNDFTGTFIPVVIDFSTNKIHFFTPGYSQNIIKSNKVAEQIELFFLPPLQPPLIIPEALLTFINMLRRASNKESVLALAHLNDIKIEEIKLITKQLYFEGSTGSETDAPRKLLYSLYLTEFLQSVESQRDREHVIPIEKLSLSSFISLDQIVTDIVENFGRAVVSNFQIGFDQSMRSSSTKDLWKKLTKNSSIIAFAYCQNCKKVVQFTSGEACPKSSFHTVEAPTYFEINELDAIQNFCTKGSK